MSYCIIITALSPHTQLALVWHFARFVITLTSAVLFSYYTERLSNLSAVVAVMFYLLTISGICAAIICIYDDQATHITKYDVIIICIAIIVTALFGLATLNHSNSLDKYITYISTGILSAACVVILGSFLYLCIPNTIEGLRANIDDIQATSERRYAAKYGSTASMNLQIQTLTPTQTPKPTQT